MPLTQKMGSSSLKVDTTDNDIHDDLEIVHGTKMLSQESESVGKESGPNIPENKQLNSTGLRQLINAEVIQKYHFETSNESF